MISDYPIDINDVKGDVIGTGINGTGNFVGKEIHYTVKGNISNIANPPKESLGELRKILYVSTSTTVDKDSNIKVASTLQELRALEKRFEEILNILKVTDASAGVTTREVTARDVHISRVDLLLKRSIVLIEQANRYWNVVTRESDINMYRAKLRQAYAVLAEANQLDEYNTEVLLSMAKVQGKLLLPSNSTKIRELLYRVQNLLDSPHNDIEKFHLAQATFLLGIWGKPIDYDLIKDARSIFNELGRRDWVRQCDSLLTTESANIGVTRLWRDKGLALLGLGQFEQAIGCFDKAAADKAAADKAAAGTQQPPADEVERRRKILSSEINRIDNRTNAAADNGLFSSKHR